MARDQMQCVIAGLLLQLLAARVAIATGPGCPTPEVPLKARVRHGAVSFYRVGQTVEYVCRPGYVLRGVETVTCVQEGQSFHWDHGPPVCIGEGRSRECPNLPAPANGRVSQSGAMAGSIASYSCNAGHHLTGHSMRVCQENGQWTGSTPQCAMVACSNLPPPDNGEVSLTGRGVGDMATYFCQQGFSLQGEVTRECQADGQWSGREPMCEAMYCGPLYPPRAGTVHVGKSTRWSMAVYQCYRGYLLVGNRTRTCLPSGEWSGDPPSCTYIVCDQLRDPEHGQVRLTGTDLDSMARYRCNHGYQLMGAVTRVCLGDQQWSGQEPTCVFMGCRQLESPVNGQLLVSGRVAGSMATYSCNTGFSLVGRHIQRMCQENGEWSGEEPHCAAERRATLCVVPEAPENGDVRVTGVTINSTATYSCNHGFRLTGSSTRTCLHSGQWSGQSIACQSISCGSLTRPLNGRVSYTSQAYSSVAQYTCNTGFMIVGERTRTCQRDGIWSGDPPLCEAITCGQLASPRNGSILFSGMSVHSTATYKCNEDHILIGTGVRVCQSNGEWSGEGATCVLRTMNCGSLPAPANGVVHITGTDPSSLANYSCNEGFSLVGEATRLCLADGSWSGMEPLCGRDCGELQNPQFGSVEVISTTAGSQAVYSCNEGFGLHGNSTRTCLPSGHWSGHEPLCFASRCPDLPAPRNGFVRMTTAAVVGSVALYACHTGFILEGAAFRTCLVSGEWSEEEPTCIFLSCRALSPPDKGLVEVSGLQVGSTATYSCQEGHQLIGDATRFCISSREWSGVAPHCISQVTCSPLSNSSNRIVEVTGVTVGSVARYSCISGYIMEGNDTRFCLPNTQWSGDPPVCTHESTGNSNENNANRCETPGTPMNGYMYALCNMPGCFARFWCATGFTLRGAMTQICQTNGSWSSHTPTCHQQHF